MDVTAQQARADNAVVKIHGAGAKMHEKLAKLGAEIAIANLEGNTDKAKRLSERYLDQMEEMANNRG